MIFQRKDSVKFPCVKMAALSLNALKTNQKLEDQLPSQVWVSEHVWPTSFPGNGINKRSMPTLLNLRILQGQDFAFLLLKWQLQKFTMELWNIQGDCKTEKLLIINNLFLIDWNPAVSIWLGSSETSQQNCEICKVNANTMTVDNKQFAFDWLNPTVSIWTSASSPCSSKHLSNTRNSAPKRTWNKDDSVSRHKSNLGYENWHKEEWKTNDSCF